jgi:UDP-4-amino-4,6-dideoxy-N-acetyl-beta-L-altrosamine N-acetyltransferase
MSKVVLREINKCTYEQKLSVRDIRNQDSVRRSMYTDHEIGLDEHLKWVTRLKDDKKQIVFVVLVEEVVSGVVSVNAIDRSHKKSDWAFYLSEKVRGGLGAALEFSLLDFVFNVLLLEKLNCEVIETNEAVVKMHKKFCFVEEGFRRENIEKEEGRIGVFFLGITKQNWLEGRSSVREKYQPVLKKFNIKIEYENK